jgi:hypothetical protein
MWAGFGDRQGAAQIAEAPAIRCDPDLADAELKNAAEVKGKVAVVLRGANSFVEKAQRAQQAGAIALIIINSDDTLVRAGGDDTNRATTIPVVVVAKAASALASKAARVSFAARAEGAPQDESEPASASMVLPMLTHGVPLLPHEETSLSLPAGWGAALKLAATAESSGACEGGEGGEGPGAGSGDGTAHAKSQVAFFFADRDGEVGSVGMLARIVSVVGVEEEPDKAGANASSQVELPYTHTHTDEETERQRHRDTETDRRTDPRADRRFRLSEGGREGWVCGGEWSRWVESPPASAFGSVTTGEPPPRPT